MFDRMFASYLAECGKLSEAALGAIFSNQEQKRVRLGVIAVSEKLMSIEQVEEVNQLQAIQDKRFGDIAVERGYLTEEQVGRLLVLQGNAYLAFVQAVVDGNFLDMKDINEMLDQFQKENSFTASNMEDLKSCDPDRVIPIFVYQQPELLQSLAGVMIRTISRLIDYHVYIKKPQVIKEYPYKAICLQGLEGDHKIMTALSGDIDGSMNEAAIAFAGGDNISCEEDVLDALCELINCVNGLFASDMSNKGVDIDMEAPMAQNEAGNLKAANLLCLPVIIYGKQIDLLLALDSDYAL